MSKRQVVLLDCVYGRVLVWKGVS